MILPLRYYAVKLIDLSLTFSNIWLKFMKEKKRLSVGRSLRSINSVQSARENAVFFINYMY